MIELHGLTKRFDERTVLDDVQLTVASGELFAFLGPNAAGKTTTIKLIVGLLKPTVGRVSVCGIDVHQDYQRAKQLLGYIPDRPYLYERLTGEEFLRFVGDVYELEPSAVDERMEDLFSAFDLLDARHRLIDEYSYGMRQKLVMSSAFLHEPRVLVVDEPMVGLDPKSAVTLKQRLKLAAQRGTTIFLSTHTLSVAEELADRVGIIDRGRLVAIGAVDELRSQLGTEGKLEELFLQITQDEPGRRPA